MIAIDSQTLCDFLKENDFDAEIQSETDQVVCIFKVNSQEFPLFLRQFDSSELLQLLVFVPVHTKNEAKNDLARFMHLINKELDIPGFGMDEESGTCFYRIMLPTPDHLIDERVLTSYLKSLKLVCEQIAPSVIAAASGKTTFEEILRKTKHDS